MTLVIREEPRGQLFVSPPPPLLAWKLQLRESRQRAEPHVFIERRRLWKTSTQTIAFRDIEHVDFEPHNGSHVSLVLKRTGEVFPLVPLKDSMKDALAGVGTILLFGFLFFMAYSMLTSGPDPRHQLAARPGELIGVPLSKPVAPIADADGVARACTGYGRNSPPNKQRCLYCGGELEAHAVAAAS